jgi:hypothetical protein
MGSAGLTVTLATSKLIRSCSFLKTDSPDGDRDSLDKNRLVVYLYNIGRDTLEALGIVFDDIEARSGIEKLIGSCWIIFGAAH